MELKAAIESVVKSLELKKTDSIMYFQQQLDQVSVRT